MTSPFWRRPIWLLGHVIALSAVVGFVRLGIWQLDRLDERRAHNRIVDERTGAPAADVESVDAATGEFRHVLATGTFDLGGEVRIRNRVYRGTVGEHVVTPLVLGDGRAVLVNRGWILLHEPVPPPPSGEVTVEGYLFASQQRRVGPRDPDEGSLEILNRVDVPRVQQQYDRALLPLWLQQTAPPPDGDYPIRLDAPATDEGPHLSYAVQWFLFAGVVGVGYPILLRRRGREAAAGGGIDERMEREHDETPEPTPVNPAPADAAPSATGVVAGDEGEAREAPPSPTDPDA